MDLHEVPLSMSGFGMGTMFANFHMCGIRNRFQHVSPRGPMCFSCPMLGLSEPCELLFCFVLLTFGPSCLVCCV